jgi:hypothetical protein
VHRGGSGSAPSPIRTQQPRSSGSWCTGFKASEQPAGLARTVAIRPPGTLLESVFRRLGIPHIVDQCVATARHRRLSCSLGRRALSLRRAAPRRSGHVRADSGGAQGNRLSRVRNLVKRSEVGVTVRGRVRGVNGANWNGYREMFKTAFGPTRSRGARRLGGTGISMPFGCERARWWHWVGVSRAGMLSACSRSSFVGGSLNDLRRHGPSVDGGRTRGGEEVRLLTKDG